MPLNAFKTYNSFLVSESNWKLLKVVLADRRQNMANTAKLGSCVKSGTLTKISNVSPSSSSLFICHCVCKQLTHAQVIHESKVVHCIKSSGYCVRCLSYMPSSDNEVWH